MKNFLGIDYGTKRIGLAINLASLVEPLVVLDNDLDQEQEIVSQAALNQIIEICQSRNIQQIVLGYSEAKMAEKTKLFAKFLKEKTDLPIVFADETLSSYEVARKMKEAAFSLKRRQGPIDHYAAAVILEDFLDTLPR